MSLKDIEQEVEVDGTPRDSPFFPIRVRERSLRVCQERRGVSKCKDCPHYEMCELVKAHMTDVKYAIPKLQAERGAQEAEAHDANKWLRML